MTIRQAISQLSTSHTKQSAHWIISNMHNVSIAQLLLNLDDILTPEEESKIEDIKSRLERGEPLQHILGEWQFIDITIKTDRRALIPRPETEILAQKAYLYAKEINASKIIDIGCGSGCIGLYLKSKIDDADVTLLDISYDALELSKENAEQLELDCTFVQGNILSLNSKTYDLIVSNPPYIKTADIEGLDENVKDYEPHIALDGGEDGLKYYRALAQFAQNSLEKSSAIFMEIGIDQAEEVREIFNEYFDDIEIIEDFNNIQRMVIARR
ncbi:MAG: peptide chain release factor N(5)-glutamine methyltransferase [Clostridiales bacterium]|nr:peptide chain release factor N(5)-glutamine methyltransferase [Clostridiales bacterium]